MSTRLKFLIPVALVLALLAALLLMFLFEKPPAYARAGAIEARFARQLVELQALAAALPAEACSGILGYEPGLRHSLGVESTSEEDNAANAHTQLAVWKERVEQSRTLFDDPVILGAELVFVCDGTDRIFGVKSYFDWRALSRAMLFPATEWPVVSIAYVTRQRVIYYQDRVEDETGTSTRFNLILDLDGLQID